MTNHPILCIGGACIDYKLKCISQPLQHTSNIVKTSYTYGGVARNVAENLSNWTNNIALQCVVGGDQLGKDLLRHMGTLGVDTGHSMYMDDFVTSHYYAILNEHGELHIACNDMEIYDHISYEQFTQSWHNWPNHLIIFLDTNLPSNIIESAIQFAQSTERMLCIDPVSVAKSAKLPDNLGNVFLLKPNQDEASVMSGIHIHTSEDAIQAAREILKRGVKNVVISLGTQGYVMANHTSCAYIEVAPIDNVVDVNGAGDSFISGILYGLKQGFRLKECCAIGHKAASISLSSHATAGQVPADCLV